jgi:hypothetical protein
MRARDAGRIAVATAVSVVAATGCGAPAAIRAGAPGAGKPWGENDSPSEAGERFAPGSDVVWIADETDTARVEVRGDHVAWRQHVRGRRRA